MINTMIVDDELWVCQLIKRVVNWESLGFRIIAEANDGEEALELTKTLKPDLIITDIRMPVLDGISLIKDVKELGLDTSFVIISGYNDFEYAREAIKYGALGYILKPINKKELTNILIEIRDNSLKNRERADMEVLMKSKLEYSLKELRDQFFLNYLVLRSTKHEKLLIEKMNQEFEMHFRNGVFQIIIYKVESKNPDDMGNNIENEVLDEIQKAVSSQFNLVCNDIVITRLNNQLLCILNYPSVKDFVVKNTINSSLDKMKCSIYMLKEFDLTLGIGSCETDINHLPVSFSEAQRAIKARILRGVDRVIDATEQEYARVEMIEIFSMSKESKLSGYLEIFDVKSAMELITQVFDIFTVRQDIDPGIVFEIAYEIIEVFFRTIRRNDFGIRPENLIKANVYHDIDECRSIKYVLAYFEKLFLETKNFYSNSKQGQNRKTIEMVKAYIQEHFNEDISLNDVANLVFLNAKYVSDLFKKETGINITDYLINYRLDIAKGLLKDVRYRITEVAEMVGYKDVRYFSKIFYKVVGISPSDYKKMFA